MGIGIIIMTSIILNLAGLSIVAYGSISAAVSTPAPMYMKDGSVNSSGHSEKAVRIKMYKRQKKLPFYFVLIGIGSLIQAAALFLAD